VSIADVLGCPLLPVQAGPQAAPALLDGLTHVEFGADGSKERTRAHDELVARLRRVDAAGGVGWADGRSPFPGLAPFEVGMARVFCGRAEEVRHLTGRLRSLADRAEGGLLLVVGPSGCGKSSLVRAGLLARMGGEPGWEPATPFAPGADPVGALGRALAASANRAGLGWTVEHTRGVLAGGGDGLVRLAEELLVAGRGPARERLLLVVDQAEELLTRADAAGRAAFAALLRAGLAGPVRVVATLRSEFCDRLLALPELAGVKRDVFPLRPLDRQMLRRVVEEPATLAGLVVDAELVEQMVADTAGGEALPLLAFTLHKLADGLTRGGELSAARYVELGGVQGALAGRADAALEAAVAASGLGREQVLAALVRLAAVDASGEPTRRRTPLAEFDEPTRAAFAVFVDARMLTTSTEPGGTWVGVAHEAFLRAWPPLAKTIDDRRGALRMRAAVEDAAAAWDGSGRHGSYLWDRTRLTAGLAALGATLRRRIDPGNRREGGVRGRGALPGRPLPAAPEKPAAGAHRPRWGHGAAVGRRRSAPPDPHRHRPRRPEGHSGRVQPRRPHPRHHHRRRPLRRRRRHGAAVGRHRPALPDPHRHRARQPRRPRGRVQPRRPHPRRHHRHRGRRRRGHGAAVGRRVECRTERPPARMVV
jgi:hypothetical protein